MALAFVVLVVTGFALKFPGAWWASPLLAFEGRIAFRGLLHRAAAVLLIASLLHHALHLLLVRRDRRILRHLIPMPKDVRDMLGMVLYNLGRRKTRPHFGVFSYAEKLEYWALLWGSLVMAGSGFLLWFNNWTLAHFPKWVSDAATAIHLYEAILAAFSILIWHFYMVIFDPEVYPMDLAWLNGKASADHMQRHRPEYYARLTRGEHHQQQAALTPADAVAPQPATDDAKDDPPADPD
jgi:formate dehydrogenase gamma subunit